MPSRTILLVALAGAVLVCAGMLGGCKKQEPVRTVPAAPAGPNSVTSRDVQKAASDLAAKTEAAAATAVDTAKAAEKAQTAADQTAKTATDAANKAADTTKAAVDTAKATAATAEIAAAAAAEQTMCPVMEAPIDKSIFVEYKGKKVYFCCSKCKADFEKDPEKYIVKLPQFK
jgi:YHS domain-containing protein